MSTHSVEPGMSPALAKAIGRVAKVATGDGRKQAELDRKRRAAFGNTVDTALAVLNEETQRVVLFAFLTEATSADRRRIATHALCDAELLDEADAEIARRREAAEAEREAAKAKAEANGTTSKVDDAAA